MINTKTNKIKIEVPHWLFGVVYTNKDFDFKNITDMREFTKIYSSLYKRHRYAEFFNEDAETVNYLKELMVECKSQFKIKYREVNQDKSGCFFIFEKIEKLFDIDNGSLCKLSDLEIKDIHTKAFNYGRKYCKNWTQKDYLRFFSDKIHVELLFRSKLRSSAYSFDEILYFTFKNRSIFKSDTNNSEKLKYLKERYHSYSGGTVSDEDFFSVGTSMFHGYINGKHFKNGVVIHKYVIKNNTLTEEKQGYDFKKIINTLDKFNVNKKQVFFNSNLSTLPTDNTNKVQRQEQFVLTAIDTNTNSNLAGQLSLF